MGVVDALKGDTALVTGGTDGVGKAIANGLAELGARVIIVGRDRDKGAHAERAIRASSGNIDVEFVHADLSSIREAHRLGDAVSARWPALQYLVHSAGMVRGRRVVTAEGVESNFATNYLSRFALTLGLLPALRAAGRAHRSARILLIAHPGFAGTIHYDDVNLTTNFSTLRAFRQFHFANDLFAAEFARRMRVPGDRPSVTISCLHPGPTRTQIDRDMPLWMKLAVRHVVHRLVSHTPDVAATAALRLLTASEFEGESGALFSMIRAFKRVAMPRNAQEPTEGARLWALSEALVSATLEQTPHYEGVT
jgi:NAD(P)-dependent dehydrogenase (short-subunit alcohol dehydrogenase family)